MRIVGGLGLVATLLVGAVGFACGGGSGGGGRDVAVRLERVASGLEVPLDLTAPPGDLARQFIAEKTGRIRILREGRLLPEPFLDLSGIVSGGNEQGLLGIAFHPGFATGGRFFVDLTGPDGATRIVEYRVGATPDRADPSSAREVLRVAQPFANHNGGGLAFGPDGYLYVALGDGGSGGDPRGNGQNRRTLLGSLLRLDVDGAAPYAIPPSNPFVADPDPAVRREIWAFGLRNPFRFSFDRAGGALYIGDVGQNEREEIDVAPASSRGGENYGWNRTEGSRCFDPPACDRTGLTPPVLDYGHDEGCSVAGGYVYRGRAIPALRGHYFYGDFCAGFVRSFRFSGGKAVERRSWPELAPGGSITSFGEDAAGELYVLTLGGDVFRLASAE